MFDGLKKLFGSVSKGASAAVTETTNAVKDFVQGGAEEESSWLGKNKGLLIGGVFALLSVFGLEGGIMPMLFAAAAIAGGAYYDKSSAEPAPSSGVPVIPTPETRRAAVEQVKENGLDVSMSGGIAPTPLNVASLSPRHSTRGQ